METLINRFFLKKVKQFKSYYVVWKRDTDIKHNEMKYKFKSYYVVWKRFSNI